MVPSKVLQVRLSNVAEQLTVAVLGSHDGKSFEIRADVTDSNQLGEYQAVYTVHSAGTLRLLVQVNRRGKQTYIQSYLYQHTMNIL